MELYNIITAALLLLVASQTSYLTFVKYGATRRRKEVETLLDTSVLIDGRIISIARSGFIAGLLTIPRSVVAELQYLADNADHDKRTRARYGLDVIQELQQLKNVTVRILQDGHSPHGVDTQLVLLAKKHHAQLCTIDYNLNKVAQVEGVIVLNVNEMAQALRVSYLPGEQRMLALTQKGNDPHQAVGHLEDGTMVVVENAYRHIGSELLIEFTRVLQTHAGRMMFAKPVASKQSPKHPPKPDSQKNATAQAQTQKNTPPKQREKKPQADNKHNRPKPSSSQRPPRRKKTNEDSLIELANR